MSHREIDRTGDKKGQYIRPQQGLSLRKSGGVVQVNLENIGGRILVLAERATHKTRMKTIKPVVNVKPPWGHEGRKQRVLRVRRGPEKSEKAQQYSYGIGGGSQQAGKPVQKEFDPSTLPEKDEEVVAAFMRLLGQLSSYEARALVEHAYRESEEQRLLSGFTGVFPELVSSDVDDAAAPSPQQHVADSNPHTPPNQAALNATATSATRSPESPFTPGTASPAHLPVSPISTSSSDYAYSDH